MPDNNLPNPDDLPVTEGAPDQDEPEGQQLGGPPPRHDDHGKRGD